MLNDLRRGFWYSIGCILGAAALNVAAKRLCDKFEIAKKREDNTEESE